MARHDWTLRPTRHVRFAGHLRMTSALHVGAGAGDAAVDMTVVRHADGTPFIPGSSLKGVLRSHLERLLQTPALAGLGVTSCLLHAQEGVSPSAPDCPTPTWIRERKDATRATEADLAALCHTCTLFGSPILAGKIRVPDLEPVAGVRPGEGERRNGVGIDRDSGRPASGVLFDYEVVPSGAVFALELTADSPDDHELALLAVAVRELMEGRLAVGAMTTRGLGACRLEGVTVEDADFREPDTLDALRDYLKGQVAPQPAGPFLDDAVDALFAA